MIKIAKMSLIGLAFTATSAYAASPVAFKAACCALGVCCGMPCCD